MADDQDQADAGTSASDSGRGRTQDGPPRRPEQSPPTVVGDSERPETYYCWVKVTATGGEIETTYGLIETEAEASGLVEEAKRLAVEAHDNFFGSESTIENIATGWGLERRDD